MAPDAPRVGFVVTADAPIGGVGHDRSAARLAVRKAIRRECGLDVPAAMPRPWHVSVAHERGLSAWAVGRPGEAVGIDVLRLDAVAAIAADERRALARLYLGADAAAAVSGAADLARAWVRHEARLKAAGIDLVEWSPAWAARLAGLAAVDIAGRGLPAGFVAALASSPARPTPDSSNIRGM